MSPSILGRLKSPSTISWSVSVSSKEIECMADRCNRYTLNSEPGDIYEQVKKMFLFGKDNFTEINLIPDDSEI